MGGGQIWWLAVLLPACTLGPGLLLVRLLRWGAAERLASAVGLSLIAVYLATWTSYVLGFPVHATARVVSALCLLSLLLGSRELARIARDRRARAMLFGWAALLAWALALLLLIRQYSGGGWFGDWYEHWERSVFFVERPDPVAARFLGAPPYALTARPPMMNVVTAHFLAMVGVRFEAYQVVSSYLSVLAFVPGALMLGLLARRGSREIAAFTCLLLLNPSFAQNATHAWTKLLAAFYALLAVALYVRGWRKADASRTVLAFTFAATGMLVHYSVAVFAVVLAAHAVHAVAMTAVTAVTPSRRWRRRTQPPEAGGGARRMLGTHVAAAAASGLVLATWLGWSLVVFGWGGTVATNTTAVDTARFSARENALKLVVNTGATLIPPVIRAVRRDVAMPAASETDPVALRDLWVVPELGTLAQQPTRLGWWRDWWFLVYQVSLVTAMGLVGGCVAVWCLARTFVRPRAAPRSTRRTPMAGFWLYFVAASVPLGIAAVGSRDRLGLAHVCLQPVILLGVATVAAHLRLLPRVVRLAVVAGSAADFILGILLHFHVQGLPVTKTAARDNQGQEITIIEHATGRGGAGNVIAKYGQPFLGLASDDGSRLAFRGPPVADRLVFLGDHLPDGRPARLAVGGIALAAITAIAVLAREAARRRRSP